MKNSQQKKKTEWMQLVRLLNEDSDWYLKPDTELYEQITTLGHELFKQKKQPGGDKIDDEKYIALKQYGYRMDQIAQAFHVSKHTLYQWRKQNGYINKQKREAVNQ